MADRPLSPCHTTDPDEVGYPHEFRWSLGPGQHVITAAMVHRPQVSQPVTVGVED